MNVKTTEDARKQASSTINEAQKQARKTVRDARREARRRLIRARVAAARMRAGNRAKTSGTSTKAVGAAGAVGLAAGYSSIRHQGSAVATLRVTAPLPSSAGAPTITTR
jgi:hypothetical protein